MTTDRLPISAFLICQDEEHCIERCIRSLSMCAEIIAVDSGSTDNTLTILKTQQDEGFALRIISEPWRGYSAQKQFALDHCTQPWCLSIDSDERVSRRLAAALPGMLAQDVAGWKLTRYDYLTGYGYVPPVAHERYHPRLFRQGAGRFDMSDLVHEAAHIEGKVAMAREGGLLHFRPIALHDQITKENRYSSLKAEMKSKRRIAPRPGKMLISPLFTFLRWYFGYHLWRCGWAGFIRASNTAVYSYLTEAKRWENAAVRKVPPVEPEEPEGF